jgi:hypothetical protein
MVAGGDTFIHDMLSRCGFTNIFKNLNRYPEISICNDFINNESIRNISSSLNNPLSSDKGHPLTAPPPSSVNNHPSSLSNCQLLLLSSEPYPFKQKHMQELQTLLPFTKIMLVDGEMFSWYGSRLLYSAQYFKKLISQIQE